jgi:hypothetical protein
MRFSSRQLGGLPRERLGLTIPSSNEPSPGLATAVVSPRTSSVTLAKPLLSSASPRSASCSGAHLGKPFNLNPDFPERLKEHYGVHLPGCR